MSIVSMPRPGQRVLFRRSCLRPIIILGLLALFVLLPSVSAFAQDANAWPDYEFAREHVINRGPGGYFSWWKLLLVWLLFLLWVATTDWVNRDCQRNSLPYSVWNLVVGLPFLVGLIVLFIVPLFLIGLPVLLLTLFVPLMIYVAKRNREVEPHERVMTRDHLRHVFAELANKAGMNVSSESKKAHEKGAPVSFIPMGSKDDQVNQANLIAARQSEGYLSAKDVIANAIDHNAEKLMLDYASESVSVRYQVDGVWHDGEALDREEGDSALGALKTIANMKVEERRVRQQGRIGVDYNKKKRSTTIVSQGTKTGERVLMQFVGDRITFHSLEELGMREKMIEQLKDIMLRDNGIILFSSMPGGGLTTTLNIALRSTDRLLRDFIAIEDKANPMEEVENVDPTYYDAAAGETPNAMLPAIVRKEPDVIVIPELPNAETVTILCEAASEDQLVFSTMPAKEAVEALLRVLLLKVPAKTFAPVAQAVVNQRLVRKLCETCKEAYEPPPALLQKLGIPAGRVEHLYRHPEDPEEVCPDCHGIGYRGRTAIFELLAVDDRVREALIKQPKLDALRKVSRASGNRSLQEEGIVAVVRGVTSLPELMRVLKQ